MMGETTQEQQQLATTTGKGASPNINYNNTFHFQQPTSALLT